MKSERGHWSLLGRTLLLALLLAAQASTAVHAFEHEATATDTLCATCSAGHAQQAAVDTGAAPPFIPQSIARSEIRPRSTPPARALTHRARAPPVLL